MAHSQRPIRRRFWGRAKGRPLSTHQQELYDDVYPKLGVLKTPLDYRNFEQQFSQLELEIGFGGAEHLLSRAKQWPERGFIGVEPFLNGVGKALAGIDAEKLQNIRLYHGDVWDILKDIPDGTIKIVHVLYPDPWPKTRHFKRRLVQEDFIAEIYRILKPDGEFRFASDIPSYVDWALMRILAQGGFDWPVNAANDWLSPYENWPSTRYEAKARCEGRTPHYLRFLK